MYTQDNFKSYEQIKFLDGSGMALEISDRNQKVMNRFYEIFRGIRHGPRNK